jgi:hypothetical protein
MGKSTINGHLQQLFVNLPEGDWIIFAIVFGNGKLSKFTHSDPPQVMNSVQFIYHNWLVV